MSHLYQNGKIIIYETHVEDIFISLRTYYHFKSTISMDFLFDSHVDIDFFLHKN